jgi:hypothetical protein
MNVLKIAWRSIQHRGLGSLLTVISMALGVMMVVAVLTIHGVVSQSFKNNNSFGYNILVGARGGGLQLTLNTVYYLSKPVENIPYEYYLAFCDAETRQRELKHSIANIAREHEAQTLALATSGFANAGGLANILTTELTKAMSMRRREPRFDVSAPSLTSSTNWSWTSTPKRSSHFPKAERLKSSVPTLATTNAWWVRSSPNVVG